MTGWNRERQKRIFDDVEQRMDHVREVIDSHFQPIDLASPSDEEFLAFVAQKQAENPNWLLALPFVLGGTSVLTRYEKLTGLRDA